MDFLTGIAVGALASALIIIVCTIIEHIAVIERYSIRSRLPGFAMNLVQVPVTTFLALPISQFWSLFPIGRLITINLWSWLSPLGMIGYAVQVLILIMVADFLIYWRHRFEHRIFWPIHMVHHSPRELHAANDIGHPLQYIFNIVFISIPISLIHFEGPSVPTVASFIVALLSYYIHSPIDAHFGPLRAVLVDNRFHRIHHSMEPRHFDKNFGVCFTLWDRLFGTAYYPEDDEWPEVGLQDVAPPRTIADYLLLPFRVPAAEKADVTAADHPELDIQPAE